MNELHFQKEKFVSSKFGQPPVEELNVSELGESETEINCADNEDNVTLDSRSEESVSLTGEKREGELEDEFNLNISFTGGYIPNTDLTRVDKGLGNP